MNKTESASAGAFSARGLLRPLFWIPVALLVAADLWTKAWAWEYVASEGSIEFPVDGWTWLAFTKLYNPGGVFGLFQDFPLPLTIFRILASGVILWLVTRQPAGNRRGVFTLGLLLAGALGNLYDNLSKWLPWSGTGEVRDFVMVDLGFWPFDPWPIFNLADSCITVGFILLITGVCRIHIHQAKPATDEAPAKV